MRTKNTTTEEQKDKVAPEKKTTSKKASTKKSTTARKPRTTKKKVEESIVEDTAINNTETTKEETASPAPVATEPQATVAPQAPATPVAPVAPVAAITPVAPVAAPVPTIPALPNIKISSITELIQAPQRAIILTDQQIQQLSLEDIERRHLFLEETLANVLDYDVVISDTNIWLELLVGHSSSHSDPRVNARLQFERQLEFISKLTKYRGGKFMIMGETYEEIDRFAAMQDPTNHKEADFNDNIVCLNAAARLAKRLILAQQRENRLLIEGISAESHHAAFADPAIIRRVVELFAEGKKVLLITNDASVAIRSIGLCDDLQRYNNISDADWNNNYASLRPMVFTFDDLKLLDYYTRQYHYIQMASGQAWMQHIERTMTRNSVTQLNLCLDAFRPGDKHRGDNLFSEQDKQIIQKKEQDKQNAQKKDQRKPQNQPKKQQAPAKTEAKPVEQQPTETKEQPAETANNEATTEKNTSQKKPRRKPQRRSKEVKPKEEK